MTWETLDLGRCGYEDAWAVQREKAEQVMQGGAETLILVEHPAVLTLGAGFHEENLLLTPEQYAERGIEIVRTDRGGDVTFHGPDQLVIYPIFNIAERGRDLHKWLRDLEQATIQMVESFGLNARRFPPHTGVWVGEKKVAAIGVKAKRWVNLHGIAINCRNDLSPFSLIVPCGISDYPVTSLTKELGREVTLEDAKPRISKAFEEVFGS